MLSIVMPSVILLSIITLNVSYTKDCNLAYYAERQYTKLIIIMLGVVMLSFTILIIVTLSVVARAGNELDSGKWLLLL